MSCSPETVTTGGAHSPLPRTSRSAPASSRAAARASSSPVAVGLVDRDDVGDLEDALLDALQLVAGAGQGQEEEGVDHPGHGDLGLADADGLDQHHVVRRRLEHRHRLHRGAGDAAERAGRGRGPDEGVGVGRQLAPSGSCRRAPSRRCGCSTGRPPARRPGGPAPVSRVPSDSMNVDFPTPGTPEMPTRTAGEWTPEPASSASAVSSSRADVAVLALGRLDQRDRLRDRGALLRADARRAGRRRRACGSVVRAARGAGPAGRGRTRR